MKSLLRLEFRFACGFLWDSVAVQSFGFGILGKLAQRDVPCVCFHRVQISLDDGPLFHMRASAERGLSQV